MSTLCQLEGKNFACFCQNLLVHHSTKSPKGRSCLSFPCVGGLAPIAPSSSDHLLLFPRTTKKLPASLPNEDTTPSSNFSFLPIVVTPFNYWSTHLTLLEVVSRSSSYHLLKLCSSLEPLKLSDHKYNFSVMSRLVDQLTEVKRRERVSGVKIFRSEASNLLNAERSNTSTTIPITSKGLQRRPFLVWFADVTMCV